MDTGFGGFAPSPRFRSSGVDLPPTGEYDAPIAGSFSPTYPARGGIDIYPGGGRTAGTHIVPGTFNSPSSLVTDPSGAGLTPSGLTGNTLRSFPSERWTPDVSGGAFVDAGASGSAEVTPTVASGGGRSPPFITDPNDDWIGDAASRTARNGLPREPGMGGEPVLFANPRSEQPSLTVDAGAGPVRSVQPNYMANFGGNLTIGQILNTPLASLGFGEGRGVGTGNVDLSQSGQDAYRNQPISGRAEIDAAEIDYGAGGFAEAEALGAKETAVAKESGELNPDGTTPGQPGGTQGTQSSLASILQAFPSLNNPAAIRAIQGGADPRQLMGRAQFDQHASNLMQMAFQAMPGNPNNVQTFAGEGRFLLDEENAPHQYGPTYGRKKAMGG